MQIFKIKFSSGKSFYIRKPTMKDHRLATQDLQGQGKEVTAQNSTENLIRFLITKAEDKDGQVLEIGDPPINLDNFIDFQEYFELMDAVNNSGVILDLKKKAEIEEIKREEKKPPSSSSTT